MMSQMFVLTIVLTLKICFDEIRDETVKGTQLLVNYPEHDTLDFTVRFMDDVTGPTPHTNYNYCKSCSVVWFCIIWLSNNEVVVKPYRAFQSTVVKVPVCFFRNIVIEHICQSNTMNVTN